MKDFQRYMADLLSENGWTPDVPFLETKDTWFVFTYASRKGKVSSYFTHEGSESTFYSIGWTKSRIYSILNVETGGKTYQLASPQGTDAILGEVWALPTWKLLELDGDERNTMRTKRIMVPVTVSRGRTIDAWMYTAHPSFLRDGPVKISKFGKYTYYGDNKFLEIE